MPTRVADALILTFSADMSLESWRANGSLAREWALYEYLAPHYGCVVLVTYGGAEDARIAAGLGAVPRVVANDEGLERSAYIAAIPDRVAALLGGAGTAVVKTNQMPGGDVALAITRRLRGAGVRVGLVARGGYLWSRFAAFEERPDGKTALEAGARERELCQAADLVVGTSEAMVGDLSWRYGLSPERTALIPNYLPDAMPQRSAEEREPATILYAGQLIPRKQVGLIVEAVAMVRELGAHSPRLSVIGDGPERDDLRALAEQRGVDAVFEPRLPHAQVVDRMSRCTIFAVASKLEGHPKAVIEAMATGAVVVVAAMPGLGRVVQHGITGLVVPDVPGAFANAIDGLLGDAAWREALGQAAAAEARAACGLERVVPLELDAHRRALELAGRHSTIPAGQVRFDAELLGAGQDYAVEAFARAIAGFARRLEPRARAQFLAGLDAHVYQLQGEAAVAAEGDLHPKHRLTRYHDFFVDRIGGGQRVVDLGCGVGALAASIAERSGAAVTGVDWSAANLCAARALADRHALGSRLAFREGDITADRTPGGFDVVVLSNVLEHLKDRPSLLTRWREWYGARTFLIRVPAFDREWRVPWKKELGVEWRLDDTHETEYTAAQLQAELEQAGLRIAECQARWGEYWVRAEAA